MKLRQRHADFKIVRVHHQHLISVTAPLWGNVSTPTIRSSVMAYGNELYSNFPFVSRIASAHHLPHLDEQTCIKHESRSPWCNKDDISALRKLIVSLEGLSSDVLKIVSESGQMIRDDLRTWHLHGLVVLFTVWRPLVMMDTLVVIFSVVDSADGGANGSCLVTAAAAACFGLVADSSYTIWHLRQRWN